MPSSKNASFLSSRNISRPVFDSASRYADSTHVMGRNTDRHASTASNDATCCHSLFGRISVIQFAVIASTVAAATPPISAALRNRVITRAPTHRRHHRPQRAASRLLGEGH